jgi:hypothetical protein
MTRAARYEVVALGTETEMKMPIAFVAGELDLGIEVVVNFGVVTGREATQAEVDRLARAIQPDVERLAIVAARRHEYGDTSDTVVHQVVVEASGPDGAAERIRTACEMWVADCAADRRLDALDV